MGELRKKSDKKHDKFLYGIIIMNFELTLNKFENAFANN